MLSREVKSSKRRRMENICLKIRCIKKGRRAFSLGDRRSSGKLEKLVAT
jgi:hypothetical protein